MWILYNAAAGNWAGTPVPAPEPLQLWWTSDFQPYLTDDCNTIYFSSNRNDVPGITGPIIYKSTYSGDVRSNPTPEIWSSTFGVGEATLTSDGKKLYFVQVFKESNGGVDSYNADVMVTTRD